MRKQKGAMFGLEDRALIKQSGRLFLASLIHFVHPLGDYINRLSPLARYRKLTSKRLVAGQQATRIKTQRGAMFGLDARIALAIFGALSVISGAALYSAIQQSRIIATVAELTELGKAHEAYYLDTGIFSLKSGTSDSSYWQLLENTNNVAGWQGPYISKAKGTVSSRLAGPTPIGDYEYTTAIYESGAWGANDVAASGGLVICDAGDDCSVYVGIVATKNQKIAEMLDAYIDGSVDYRNGRFRIYQTGVNVYWLWYQIMKI